MMNKSRGDMYPWITHTLNMIKGHCVHECRYCFMKRWGTLNPLHFDDSELKTDLGSGNFIFVGSSTDDFAEGVPSEWIIKMLDHCDKYENRYLFQSKNPKRFLEFIEHPVFRKAVVCTTIESNRFYPEIMMNSPRIESRVQAMAELAAKGGSNLCNVRAAAGIRPSGTRIDAEGVSPTTGEYRAQLPQRNHAAGTQQ